MRKEKLQYTKITFLLNCSFIFKNLKITAIKKIKKGKMATQILFCFMILSLIVASTKEQASGIESRKIGSGVDDTKEYFKELLSGLQNALQQLQPFSGGSVIQEQLQQLQQALSSGSGFQEQLQQLQQALSSGSGFQEQLQQLKSLSGGSEFQEQLQQLQQLLIDGTGFQE
jgi:hypothetical protein